MKTGEVKNDEKDTSMRQKFKGEMQSLGKGNRGKHKGKEVKKLPYKNELLKII